MAGEIAVDDCAERVVAAVRKELRTLTHIEAFELLGVLQERLQSMETEIIEGMR